MFYDAFKKVSIEVFHVCNGASIIKIGERLKLFNTIGIRRFLRKVNQLLGHPILKQVTNPWLWTYLTNGPIGHDFRQEIQDLES